MQKKLVAEGFGTFILALAVLSSTLVDAPALTTPVIAGLVVGLFVYTIANTSGSHINPGVTVGLWSIGKISTRDAALYIVAQVLGAMIAFNVAFALLGETSLGTSPESLSVFLAELIGMTVFTFGIAAFVYGKVQDGASGLVVGGSLLLGILLAVHLGSMGILNPALALSLGSLSFSYVFGALFGGMIGMNLYKRFIL